MIQSPSPDWIIRHPLSVLCVSAVNLDLKEAHIDLKGQWNQLRCTEILPNLDSIDLVPNFEDNKFYLGIGSGLFEVYDNSSGRIPFST